MNIGRIIRAVVAFFVVGAALLVLLAEVAMLIGAYDDIERRRAEISDQRAALADAERERDATLEQHPELAEFDDMKVEAKRCFAELEHLYEKHPEVAVRIEEKSLAH